MLTVIELFSGIGAPRKALINLGIDHIVEGISEIDKWALKSYESIYGPTKNYGDISKISELNYADLWTYGFPCQDISIAGNKLGIIENVTRSGLLYHVKRLLDISYRKNQLPKYLLMENVKNLLSYKFIKDFNNWCKYLESIGYTNYYQVLNAKDYGIPQNRERVILVSVRNDIHKNFEFPIKQKLKLKLGDILEQEVAENFYLTDIQIKKLLITTFRNSSYSGRVSNPNSICGTLLARDHCGPKCIEISIIDDCYNSRDVRIFNKISPTLRANRQGLKVLENKVIRKLTPLEYWRLMGFSDDDFNKAKSVCSNTQLYKQAGNSIVVNVLEAVFRKLLL